MSTFDKVSDQYRRKALVQQAAAEKLMTLLNIGVEEDVLDVACGPGHITQKIKEMTQGRVVGTDISAGMIHQAQDQHSNIEFRRVAAENLTYREEFDLVFCNSSFQWFSKPIEAVAAMKAALRPAGRVGISCPATENWSTCFKRVAEEAGAQPDVRSIFARWKSPWFYLPNAEAYRKMMESQRFRTLHCQIDLEETQFDFEQALAVFASGAAQGYTSGQFYDVEIDEDYVRRFHSHVRHAMEKRARDGKVTVDFQRWYYVGIKT